MSTGELLPLAQRFFLLSFSKKTENLCDQGSELLVQPDNMLGGAASWVTMLRKGFTIAWINVFRL